MRAALLALLSACASDPPLPTCEEAIDAYYDAGCSISIANDRAGAVEWSWAGRDAYHRGEECIAEYDELRVCLAEMPNGCDCEPWAVATNRCRY
jgi:hypothetical protein